MMKSIIHKIIGCILLVCLTLPVMAQQDQKGFDAIEQVFQKRYRHPDAVPFDTLWKNNISFSIYAGMDKFVPRGAGDFNTGPVGGLGMNWRFAPSHTLRGALQMGKFGRKIDNETLLRLGIQADYLLNLTSFTKGYNPGRLFEVSALAGVGYQFASFLNKNEHAADLHLGLQLKLHPTPNVDFYLEPRFSLMSDGIDHSDQMNWHKYDMTYGAVVGMTYHLKAWKPFGSTHLLEGESMWDNTFIGVAGGGQFQWSKLTNELGIVNAIGPHFSISAGKWLIPAFGLRLSAFKSADTWHSKILEGGEKIYEMSTYGGGRLEGVFDVTHFLKTEDSPSPFSINLLAGGEIGVIKKENGYDPAKGGYTGFTGGIQFKYQLFEDFSVYLEPRVSMASFSLQTNQKEEGRNKAEKYTDNLFSLNLGIELARSNEEKRLARWLNLEEFTPSFFASAGAGFSIPLQMKRFHLKRYFDYQAMVAAGYVMTPLSSVRVSGDFGPYSIDLKTQSIKYNMATAGLDYLFNVTNMMMGYDPERKIDAQFLAGVIGSMRMKPSVEMTDEELGKSKFFLGGEIGAHVSYQVYGPIKVYLEPKVRIYSNKLLLQSSLQGVDLLPMMHIGTTFTF